VSGEKFKVKMTLPPPPLGETVADMQMQLTDGILMAP